MSHLLRLLLLSLGLVLSSSITSQVNLENTFVTLGPLDSQQRHLLELYLESESLPFQVRETSSSESLGYIVVSPEVSSRTQGRETVSDLTSNGIKDVLLISRGAYRDRISAGTFPSYHYVITKPAPVAISDPVADLTVIVKDSKDPAWNEKAYVPEVVEQGSGMLIIGIVLFVTILSVIIYILVPWRNPVPDKRLEKNITDSSSSTTVSHRITTMVTSRVSDTIDAISVTEMLEKGKTAIRVTTRALQSVWNYTVAVTNRILDYFPKRTPASTRYRYLVRQIAMDLAKTKGCRKIIFSSTDSLKVNSEILMMFAYFLQDELGCKVLMIDGTFRDEGITGILGYHGAQGFMNLLYEDGLKVADMIQSTARADIFVLPSGFEANDGYLPIAEKKIQSMLEKAGKNFDYILIQHGPITLDSRYLLFTDYSDLVLWHVAEGSTRLEEFQRCQKIFRDHHVENVRLIMSES